MWYLYFQFKIKQDCERERDFKFHFPGKGLSLFVLNFDERFFVVIFITANIILLARLFFSLSLSGIGKRFRGCFYEGNFFFQRKCLTLNRKREMK